MVSSVSSHTNATRIGWHLWEIDLRFAPGLPPGWVLLLQRGRGRAGAESKEAEHQSMSLKYEPASEPLHISVKAGEDELTEERSRLLALTRSSTPMSRLG